ncbi:unnamed protein product [Boreogadus saida]
MARQRKRVVVLCGGVLPTFASTCETQGERDDRVAMERGVRRKKGIRSELCLERGWRRPGESPSPAFLSVCEIKHKGSLMTYLTQRLTSHATPLHRITIVSVEPDRAQVICYAI